MVIVIESRRNSRAPGLGRYEAWSTRPVAEILRGDMCGLDRRSCDRKCRLCSAYGSVVCRDYRAPAVCRACGSAVMWAKADPFCVDTVGVAPEAKGHGVGATLQLHASVRRPAHDEVSVDSSQTVRSVRCEKLPCSLDQEPAGLASASTAGLRTNSQIPT